MRYVVIFSLLMIFYTPVTPQVNYYRTSLNIGSGFTKYDGDLPSGITFKPTLLAEVAYTLSAQWEMSAQLQEGWIAGGDSIRDAYHRFFSNHYKALLFNLAWRPVGNHHRTDWVSSLGSDLYFGTGVGWLENRLKRINRTVLNAAGKAYIFPGADRSSDLTAQVMIGLQHCFTGKWNAARFGVKVQYQALFTNGDDLDGYNDPPLIFHNRSRDKLEIYAVGISWFFGREAWN